MAKNLNWMAAPAAAPAPFGVRATEPPKILRKKWSFSIRFHWRNEKFLDYMVPGTSLIWSLFSVPGTTARYDFFSLCSHNPKEKQLTTIGVGTRVALPPLNLRNSQMLRSLLEFLENVQYSRNNDIGILPPFFIRRLKQEAHLAPMVFVNHLFEKF